MFLPTSGTALEGALQHVKEKGPEKDTQGHRQEHIWAERTVSRIAQLQMIMQDTDP